MTEQEYILEMLCSLPLELLKDRIHHKEHSVPDWLKNIDDNDVKQAILHYNDDLYIEIRKLEKETIS